MIYASFGLRRRTEMKDFCHAFRAAVPRSVIIYLSIINSVNIACLVHVASIQRWDILLLALCIIVILTSMVLHPWLGKKIYLLDDRVIVQYGRLLPIPFLRSRKLEYTFKDMMNVSVRDMRLIPDPKHYAKRRVFLDIELIESIITIDMLGFDDDLVHRISARWIASRNAQHT